MCSDAWRWTGSDVIRGRRKFGTSDRAFCDMGSAPDPAGRPLRANLRRGNFQRGASSSEADELAGSRSQTAPSFHPVPKGS